MRTNEIGAARDRKILLEIERAGVLDTEQVRVLFFRHLAHGRRIAQKRLQVLHERGRVERGREYGRPYYYYMKQRKDIDHRIGVNWVYCWFVANLKSWERLEWQWEHYVGHIRPDAVAIITNTKRKENAVRTVCIEFDRDTESRSDIREKYDDEQVFVCTVGKKERFAGFECVTLDEIKRGLGSA